MKKKIRVELDSDQAAKPSVIDFEPGKVDFEPVSIDFDIKGLDD